MKKFTVILRSSEEIEFECEANSSEDAIKLAEEYIDTNGLFFEVEDVF